MRRHPVIALTRAVSSSLANCELTHVERTVIDLRSAQKQHEAYEQALGAVPGAIPIPPTCAARASEM